MRPEKQLLLDEIKEKINDSNAFIITKYQNLNSLAIYDFRNKVAKTKGEFEVVRKRMFLKAVKDCNINIDPEMLEGHVGVVFSQGDIVEAAKTVVEYGKKNNDAITVLCGLSEGQILDSQQVIVISTLPDKNTMRAQLIGLFEAPMSQTLATMDALMTCVMHCLDNKAKKNEQ